MERLGTTEGEQREPDETGGDASRLSQRRLVLRGGLGAAPVLLSLVSAPVGAATCTTASAFASLQPSGTRSTTSCGGRSPSEWSSTSPSQWPVSQGAMFGSVFSPALNPDMKIKDLFALSDSAATLLQRVAKHCAAAYLNATTSPALVPSTILNAALAKSIWNSFALTGGYDPAPGLHWDATKIIAWISTTYASTP